MVRRFVLPVSRSYGVRATLSADAVPDPTGPDGLDTLEGVDPRVRVTASSQRDASVFRASRAFDGDPLTGWQPDGTSLGQWVQATFPERPTDAVAVHVATDSARQRRDPLDSGQRRRP